jgi:hypothetical protein
MIQPAVIRDIEVLLEEGQLSHRQIAEMVGVARGTVAAVLRGHRRSDDLFTQPPPEEPQSESKQPPRRCPSCGGTVRMPCKLCRVRELVAGKRLRPPARWPGGPIGLELKPEDYARYVEVRRRRREAVRLGFIRPAFCDQDGLPVPSQREE